MLFLEIISKSAKMPKYGDENSWELFLKISSSLAATFFSSCFFFFLFFCDKGEGFVDAEMAYNCLI